MPAVSFTLLIDDAPASPELLDVLQQIEVEDHAQMADMLRVSLAVGVRENGSGWNVLDDGLFKRLTNIKVKVKVGSGSDEPLIDAFVIETNADFSNEPGRSMLRAVAMDPTVLMNLEEKVRPWPDMADSAIASAIYGEYGFEVEVEQTQPSRQEVNHTTIQRGTDIQFLRQLAERNGYECYVETDPQGGNRSPISTNRGWNSPPRACSRSTWDKSPTSTNSRLATTRCSPRRRRSPGWTSRPNQISRPRWRVSPCAGW